VIGSILGALIGAVAGSAIGPEAHKSSGISAYNLTGMQLLEGDYPKATAAIRSTHGRAYAGYAGMAVSKLLTDAINPQLGQYREILRGLPLPEEVAKELSPFEYKGLLGGRTKHIAMGAISMAQNAPKALKQWWDQSALIALLKVGQRHPETYGPMPWLWLEGKKWKTGQLGWSERGEEIPYAGYYKEGGFVRKTGWAYVHKGEQFVPKEKGGVPTVQNTFNINVTAIDASDFRRKIHREIIPEIEDKFSRYGHIRYTIKEGV